jgi:hypothetical protein
MLEMNWQEQAGYERVFQAGMEVENIFGGWDAQPLSTESRRMVIIARK